MKNIDSIVPISISPISITKQETSPKILPKDSVCQSNKESSTAVNYNSFGEIPNINEICNGYENSIFSSIKSMEEILANNKELFAKVLDLSVALVENRKNEEGYLINRYGIHEFIHDEYPNLFDYTSGIDLTENLDDLLDDLLFISGYSKNILDIKGDDFCFQLRNDVIIRIKEKIII